MNINVSKNQKNLEQIHQWFLRSGQTLGFAESCTGGLLSALLTAQPGVSSYYRGTIVSYSSEAKVNLLGVPRSLLQVMGEVSLPVAKYMARGAKKALQCHWAVGITGIAGPSGGTPDKPVGTVCFAVCGPGFERVELQRIEGAKRSEIQLRSAEYALKLLQLGIQS